jgi:chemotaxis family two-component system response regulator Rcp1
MRTDPQPLDILIIENDAAVARITKEAFKEAGLMDTVVAVPDGDVALSYLRREDPYVGRRHPNLIFLDLHLPKKSGLEVLAELKANSKLKVIPVVVVSGSADPREIREAYELHASCYVRKPGHLEQFIAFAQSCYEFWGRAVIFPKWD